MTRLSRDAVWITAIIVVGTAVIVNASGRALDPIIDTGRDLYIPEQIRNGTKLYRDIAYYYPPLAPYLLALITAGTGSSLAAYHAIGSMIALVTAIALFALCRTTSVSPHAAGCAALLFVSCSVYSISGRTSNYLFPYAHAATLSMLFFLGAAAFLAWWAFVDRRERWLAPAMLLLVAAAWTKLEFVVFSAVIVLVVALVHRIPLRWIGGAVALSLVSLIAVDRYFADASPGRHWLADNVLASSLLSGSSARFFYRQVSGFDRFGANASSALLNAVVLAGIVLFVRATDRARSKFVFVLVAVLLAVSVLPFGSDLLRGFAVVEIVMVPFAIRRPREPLLFNLLLALLPASRIFLRMTPAWYGFVFLVPTYAFIGYLFFEWLPSRNVYSRRASALLIFPICAIGAHCLWTEHNVIAAKQYPIRSDRGLFYDANLGRAAALDGLLDWTRKAKPRSLVVVPEGLTVNYLAGTPTPLAYHTFTPVEAADARIESQIISDFVTHPPQYVAVVSRAVTDFGYRGFGLDYDRTFAAVIQQHYTPVARWHYPSFELILLRIK